MTPFKIGSRYLSRGGDVVLLMDTGAIPDFIASDYRGTTAARAKTAIGFCGWRRLDNGRLGSAQDNPDSHYHLLPGEVNEKGHPIAPTFYCAAETLKVDPTENIYAANPDEMTFEELMADFLKAQRGVITRPGIKFVAKVPDGLTVTTADLHMVARDDKRPPLEWARSKAPDRFPGFSILRDTATPDHAYSHPLTRVADAGAQVSAQHGSAHILPKA